MLMKAFGRMDEIKMLKEERKDLARTGVDLSEEKKYLGKLPKKVRLMRADCLNLQ